MPSRNSSSNQSKIDPAWQNTEQGLLLQFIFGKTKELYTSTLQTVVVGLVYEWFKRSESLNWQFSARCVVIKH